jgi:uncharacterized cupin superfamily protein
MTRTFITITVLAIAIGITVSVPAGAHESSAAAAKISKDEFAGKIFERPDMEEATEDGNTTQDVTSFMSSDAKFGTGVYKTGKVRWEITEPWGVDEFIYVLEGSFTLTSSDGTVQVVNTGEAVTLAKEWTGVLDTEGFTQIWAIYSEDGSGLE